MFRLQAVILGQFGYYQSQRFELDGEHTLIGGDNHTGKSTLIDAMRLCLGSDRTYQKKRGAGYLRPDNAYHVVAIWAYNRTLNKRAGPFYKVGRRGEQVTLARVWIPKGGTEYESRYFIEDGQHDVPDLLRMAKEGKGMGLHQYLGFLKEIGLTPDRLDNLIVKQGQVGAISEQNGRQVYQMVMQAAGVTPTVKQYEEARRVAVEAAKALSERNHEVDLQTSVLSGHRATQERRRRWNEYHLHILEYEAESKASDVQAQRRRMNSAEGTMANAVSEQGRIRPKLIEDRAELPADEEREQNLDIQLNRLDMDAQEHARRLESASKAFGKASTAKAELGQANQAIAAAANLPVAAILEPTHRQAKEERDRASAKWLAAKDLQIDAQRRIADAHSGRRTFPAPVVATLAALEKADIPHDVLADVLNPPAVGQAHLEHALGDLRYTILVSPGNHRRAVQIAAANQHPGPIHAGTATPPWVGDYAATDKEAESPHGTWISRASPLVLGKVGSKAHLKALEKAAQDAAEGEASALAALQDAEGRLADAERNLAAARAAHDAKQVLARRDEILKQYELAEAEYMALKSVPTQSRAVLSGKLDAVKTSIRERKQRIRDAEKALAQHDKSYNEAREAYTEAEARIAALEHLMSPEWLERARNVNEPLRSPRILQELIDGRRKDIEAIGQEPPANIDEVVRTMERNLDRLRDNLKAIGDQNDKAQKELEAARRQYAQWCNQHAALYCKRLQHWAKSFNIDIHGKFTEIRADTADDQVDNAELTIEAGFDGKRRQNIAHEGFSGGDRVLLGMIMRLAMTNADEAGPDGFFIVDQPYDHLSSINTIKLAEHLRTVQLHIIIVVPTSDSVSHYHGVVRAIKMHKAVGEWAPPPIIMGTRPVIDGA